MDYEVFLLSRIKEQFDDGGDNRAAVASGLQRTGWPASRCGHPAIAFSGAADTALADPDTLRELAEPTCA